MEKRGHDVVLITAEPMRLKGIPQWVVGMKIRMKLVTFLTQMMQTKMLIAGEGLDGDGFDIIHAHYAYGYGVLGAYAKFSPLVVTAMGNDIGISSEKSWLIRNGVKYTMKRMALMTVKDQLAVKRALELGCEAEKLMVLPSWCDTNLFTPKARSHLLRDQWTGVNDDTVVVLFVRPMNEEYRARVLLDAMEEVLTETNKVRFLVANRGDDHMIEAARHRGAQIIPKIPYDQMHFYTASADVSVDTYYPEFDVGGHGHGTNFIEALASGTPVIVPNRPEYNDGWMKGTRLYEKGNPSALAEAILSLLDAKERRRLGNLGREAVCAHASERVCLDRMEKVYTELSSR